MPGMRAPLLAASFACLGACLGGCSVGLLGAAEAVVNAPAAVPTAAPAAASADAAADPAAAAKGAVAPAGPHAYAVGSSGMALSAPADWSATHDLDGAQLVLRSPPPAAINGAEERERARAAVSVVVQELRSPESPESFARRCRADLERLGTAVEVSGQEPVTLGGRIWTRLGYRFQVGRFRWQQELYATTIDGTGFCVTCSCIDGEFTRWQAAFAAVLGSLEHSRPTLEGH
jgi:hypothetical protein